MEWRHPRFMYIMINGYSFCVMWIIVKTIQHLGDYRSYTFSEASISWNKFFGWLFIWEHNEIKKVLFTDLIQTLLSHLLNIVKHLAMFVIRPLCVINENYVGQRLSKHTNVLYHWFSISRHSEVMIILGFCCFTTFNTEPGFVLTFYFVFNVFSLYIYINVWIISIKWLTVFIIGDLSGAWR